jgi:hypothetical protein
MATVNELPRTVGSAPLRIQFSIRRSFVGDGGIRSIAG